MGHNRKRTEPLSSNPHYQIDVQETFIIPDESQIEHKVAHILPKVTTTNQFNICEGQILPHQIIPTNKSKKKMNDTQKSKWKDDDKQKSKKRNFYCTKPPKATRSWPSSATTTAVDSHQEKWMHDNFRDKRPKINHNSTTSQQYNSPITGQTRQKKRYIEARTKADMVQWWLISIALDS